MQGTAIGKALEQALLSFSGDTGESRSRVIVLITDGENHDDDALAVAERAAQMGINIYTIGIGTPEGAPIQIGGEFIKDERGEMVVSKLNEEMLMQIAEATGGAYVRANEAGHRPRRGGPHPARSTRWSRPNSRRSVSRSTTNSTSTCSSQPSCCCWPNSLLLDRRNPLLAHLNIFREK